MGVVWAGAKGHSVFEAVEAVQQALGEAAQIPTASATEELFMGDGYLAENVGVMRASWEISPWSVVPGGTGIAGRAFTLGQQVARRLTWWHTQPQAAQASRFNAAVVRATDALLARVLRMAQRIHELEATHSEPRLRGFEEQLRLAREEQLRLAQRVVQLESELAALRLTDHRRGADSTANASSPVLPQG
jgi:hypothetical protein